PPCGACICARVQAKFLEAESLYLEALPVFERDPRREFRERTVIALSNLSIVHTQMKRSAEGLSDSTKALTLLGAMSEPPVDLVFKTTANVAAVSAAANKPERAISLFQSAVTLCETRLCPDYYVLGNVLDNYAEVLRRMGRSAEAKATSKRGKAILQRFDKQNMIGLTVDAAAFR